MSELFVILPTVLLLDYAWLSLSLPMYSAAFERVQKEVLRIRPLGAVLSYAALVLLVWLFALPMSRVSVWYAALLGACVYGVFNATNYAVFSLYDPMVALVDTAWGAALVAVTCAVTIAVTKRFPAIRRSFFAR